MHAIIPKTRCQGKWVGDEDGTAPIADCPYLYISMMRGPVCNFLGRKFSGRRLKGCAWGTKAIMIRVEEVAP